MGDTSLSAAHEPSATAEHFVLGLKPSDIEEFRTILREEYDETVTLSEAWARATQLLALFHYFLIPSRDSGQSGLELPPDP